MKFESVYFNEIYSKIILFFKKYPLIGSFNYEDGKILLYPYVYASISSEYSKNAISYISDNIKGEDHYNFVSCILSEHKKYFYKCLLIYSGIYLNCVGIRREKLKIEFRDIEIENTLK
jgi:hypothetical protein